MGAFVLIYNSFLWGIVVSIIAFHSMWLEMRINVGIIIPIIAIIVPFVLSMLFKRKQNVLSKINSKFSLLNTLVCTVGIMVFLGQERLLVVPAVIIREGLGMTRVSFSTINTYLLLIITLSLVIIYMYEVPRRN